MTFHRNLNASDLHAPSVLLIENAGQSTILVGEVLLVTGYNRISRRYKVRRAIELPALALASRALIYGIASEIVPTINDRGRMVAFGIVENLEVIETPNTSIGPVIPIANNAPVFIDIDVTSSNVGKIVTGIRGQTVEAGVVIEIISAGVVTAFIFSLTAGFVDFAETRALKANIPFDTSDTSIWVPDGTGDLIGTIVHDLDRLDFSVQFYEYTDQTLPVEAEQGSIGGTIDVDWRTDTSNPLNAIIVTLPANTAVVPFFLGYIEIIY